MKQFIILKDAVLTVPLDFNVVNPATARTAEHAAVIADKAGKAKHYVWLSEKPVIPMSISEEDKFQEGICKLIPELQELRDLEIPVSDWLSGKVSAEEWDDSVRIRVFAVPEVKSEKDLRNGTGIMRKGAVHGKK